MPGPTNVEVELKELELVSVSPIEVTEELGRAKKKKKVYEAKIKKNPNASSTGEMTVEETTPGRSGGGTYSLDSALGGGIYVYAQIEFSEIWPKPFAKPSVTI